MTFCLQCGISVSPEDRFCGNCGAVLQPAVAAAGSAPSGGEGVARDDEPQQVSSGAGAHAADDAEALVSNEGDQALAAAATPAPAEASDNFAPGASDATPSDELSDQFQSTLIGMEDAVVAASPEAQPPQTPVETPETPIETPVETPEPPPPDAPPPASHESAAPEAFSPEEPPQGSGTGDGGSRRGEEQPFRPTGRVGASSGAGRGASRQLEPGALLNGRFEIVKRIGGGGMGAVYYAKDKNLGDAPRAVKEMVQSNIDEAQHEKAIADFKRESMLLASLEHASIPTIYDYFYDEISGLGRFYLVMKYISGGDFLARLRNAPGGRIDELTVTDWGMQIADVLHYLHSQRPPIIYRDLKPANLMIDGNTGRVMLIDFGIARWVQKEEKGVTAVGTMGYAPPELFSGKAESRTDIYSLGATMFHLLTGADPQDNPLLIFDFTKNSRPRQINPVLSSEIESILMRAVEYEVTARFRSAAEMRDALASHLEKLRAGTVSFGPGAFASGRDMGSTTAVEMVYCGFCGGRIAPDDVFCAHCGARQPLASAAASARAARATAKLVVMGTTELNRAFELPKESNLVGRSDPHSNIFPEVDLSPFDPETKISRRHARIWRQGDTYLVEDLGSVNGTVVNETIRLGPRQPRTLEHGDKIRLGETTLHFLIG